MRALALYAALQLDLAARRSDAAARAQPPRRAASC